MNGQNTGERARAHQEPRTEKKERERAEPGERSTGQTITLVSWRHGYCAEPGGGGGGGGIGGGTRTYSKGLGIPRAANLSSTILNTANLWSWNRALASGAPLLEGSVTSTSKDNNRHGASGSGPWVARHVIVMSHSDES